jgi:acyl carrier protein
MQATPATWRMLLDAGARLPARLRVLAGGEALPPALVGQLAQASESSGEAGLELWNLYGPTETTVWSALDRVDAAEVAAQGKVAIGRPIDNTGLYLASERWELAPIGVTGQLLIGGHGLARGYHGRPGLTAERFRPDPFSRQAGQRLYCTGDLARRREDGRLDFMGRIDHQVKVRGFRIELGEVEAALLSHDDVAQAVVVARRDAGGGGDTLIAYVVPATDADGSDAVAAGPNAAALVEHLRRSLPSYMVPSAFLALSEVPLTPNGKVDRKALPEPGGVLPLARAQYLAPRTPLEEHLVALWTAVLGVEPIGVQDSFFVLGGHSLAAGRVLARVRDRLGVELPLSVMFDTPTVEALAAAVEAAGGSLDGADSKIQATAAALSDDELDALLGEMLTEKGVR